MRLFFTTTVVNIYGLHVKHKNISPQETLLNDPGLSRFCRRRSTEDEEESWTAARGGAPSFMLMASKHTVIRCKDMVASVSMVGCVYRSFTISSTATSDESPPPAAFVVCLLLPPRPPPTQHVVPTPVPFHSLYQNETA